nr:uncharacterized protein LOC123765171 [Procambarus clarkii]
MTSARCVYCNDSYHVPHVNTSASAPTSREHVGLSSSSREHVGLSSHVTINNRGSDPRRPHSGKGPENGHAGSVMEGKTSNMDRGESISVHNSMKAHGWSSQRLSIIIFLKRVRVDLSVIIFPVNRCTQIKTYSWDNAQVILVGNKCDMEDERVISYERGKQLADQLGLEFYETSAKENINVKAVFERLVDIICDKMSESLDTDPNLVNANKGTRLTENPQPQNGSCQC